MKKLILGLSAMLIFAIILAAVCLKFLPMPLSIVAWCIVTACVGGVVYGHFKNRNLRKKWLENTMNPASENFDDFFWNLTITNQDWYIDNLLKEDGLYLLLGKYENKIKQIWHDEMLSHYQKAVKSSVYLERIKMLSYALEFNYHLK